LQPHHTVRINREGAIPATPEDSLLFIEWGIPCIGRGNSTSASINPTSCADAIRKDHTVRSQKPTRIPTPKIKLKKVARFSEPKKGTATPHASPPNHHNFTTKNPKKRRKFPRRYPTIFFWKKT
jgi:hypothetical protein